MSNQSKYIILPPPDLPPPARQPEGFPEYDPTKLRASVRTLVASVGVGKSRMFRKEGARSINITTREGIVGIAVDRHDLGAEQADKFYEEHPNTALVARIWRGRGAEDPEYPQPTKGSKEPKILMCQRNEDAEEVGKHGFSVEKCLCRHVDPETGDETLCPHYSEDAAMPCGYQRQQLLHANVWFFAHETLLHETPAVFGTVLRLFIDEDPLDAFLFGLDEKEQKQYTLALDALTEVPTHIEDDDERERLTKRRRKLHQILTRLRLGPVPVNPLREFDKEEADEMLRLEWKNKIDDVDITPDMDSKTIKQQLAKAAINRTIKTRATLWKLIGAAVDQEIEVDGVMVWPNPGQHKDKDIISGRIEIVRDIDGNRMIRMKGVREIAGGFYDIPTLIGSATLDHDLLLPIWPSAKPYPPVIVPKPPHVIVRQVIDRVFSKSWFKADNEHDMIDRAQDVYAMILREATKFAPLDSLVVVHKVTEDAIREHCFVPDWIKLTHHGAVSGRDNWKDVRGEFIVGRPMPRAYDITMQAEALFGEHIPACDYVEREVAIPIVADAAGNNTVYVKQYQHAHPMGERLRKRVVEGGVLQAVGRTRYILRKADSPLDIWLVNDVPMGEHLGPVVAVELAEIAPSLDDLMWTKGVWLENAADAARAFPTLIASETALRMDRSRGRSVTNAYNRFSYRELLRSSLKTTTTTITYRRVGKGLKNARAVFMVGVTDDPKLWLTERLGPLAHFTIDGTEEE